MNYYFLRHNTTRTHPEEQVCYSIKPTFPPGSFSWCAGMPLPHEFDGPVEFELEELFTFADYIPAINAPVLVTIRLKNLILEQSSSATAYPAVISHKSQTIRNDVYAINFERCLDCVDHASSELEFLDLGDGLRVPYRYRHLRLDPSRIPNSEGIFVVNYCGDPIVSQLFRDHAEQKAITGCEFFDFKGFVL